MAEISWGILRERPIDDIEVGWRIFMPDAFSGYWSGKDGRVAPLIGCGCSGTVWVVLARDGERVTIVKEDGTRKHTTRIDPTIKTILRVLSPVELAKLRTASEVCDQLGYWHAVVRVNRKTVTATRFDYTRRIPHNEIFEVR